MPSSFEDSAAFAFEGSVKRVGDANVQGVRDRSRTAVVTVETVVRAPQALVGLERHDVTIRLADGESVTNGERAVFYTNSWIFAENVALLSLGHEPAPAAAAMAGSTVGRDPARAAAHHRIRQRVSAAAAVVSGKVTAIGLPGAPVAAAAAGPAPAVSVWISEHNPFWHDAFVEVQHVHKGAVGKNQVLVRFPSSTDVRWYRAPKFHTGQEGVFSLHDDRVSGHPIGAMALAVGIQPGAVFTCLSPADFQPAEKRAEVAAAIAATSGAQ
jgi:hypothetical protein